MPTEVSAGGASAPQTVMEHAARVVDILRAHDQILVSGHINPDGDAVGSSSAMVWLLRRMGKQAALYNATGVPEYLHWMPLPGEAYRYVSRLPFKPALLVSLDCGDSWCLGKELVGMLPQLACVNVDHHQGNPRFGTLYNWIDPRMAATGQMVAALADAAGIPLDGELAAGLELTGPFFPHLQNLPAELMADDHRVFGYVVRHPLVGRTLDGCLVGGHAQTV